MKSIKITLRNIAFVVVSALVMTACADAKKDGGHAAGANEADVSRFVGVLTEEEKSEGWEYLLTAKIPANGEV
jgi:hypothetical protein